PQLPRTRHPNCHRRWNSAGRSHAQQDVVRVAAIRLGSAETFAGISSTRKSHMGGLPTDSVSEFPSDDCLLCWKWPSKENKSAADGEWAREGSHSPHKLALSRTLLP